MRLAILMGAVGSARMERVYVYVYVWGQAYWLERPVGLIAKATGQRLTQDYITNPPRAAPLPTHAATPNRVIVLILSPFTTL